MTAVLIILIGGRIVPSFTRNWLAKHGGTSLPGVFRSDRQGGVCSYGSGNGDLGCLSRVVVLRAYFSHSDWGVGAAI